MSNLNVQEFLENLQSLARKEAGASLIWEDPHWYSAHSFPTALAPVVKAFYTTKKIKYAKYHKDT